MDRVFLDYYEDELGHIRALAAEFADMHPAVARNLSLDAVPCPDPYVERLLEGVAFLAARTRLKVDAEGARFVRDVIEALYPDLTAPTPATGIVALKPGQQVLTMLDGHVVRRGTRLVSSLRPGLSTRCTYTTAQDVTLWPVEITGVDYLQDRGALAAAGIGAIGGASGVSGLRLTLGRIGKGALAELSLDRLDLHFADRARAPAFFDAIFGACVAVGARPEGRAFPLAAMPAPEMIGIRDDEALLPRTRPSFEGYRLLREYFVAPERFHFVRLGGVSPVLRAAAGRIEIVILFRRAAPELAGARPGDLLLHATPIVNLFERDCGTLDLDARRTRQVLHADRARPRDFEILRVTHVEDADGEGPEALVPELFSLGQASGGPWVHSTERRPRRPAEDERRQGQTRTSYAGDDVFLAVSRPAGDTRARPLRRLDIRALCTNRDLPILDDTPTLTPESGDPIEQARLLGALRPPLRAVAAAPPGGPAGASRADELTWRLVAQLSLNFLGLAEAGTAATPLRALLELYADRGDPGLARHARAVTGVHARPVIERLPFAGPMCFGRGVEITLDIDQSLLSGHSALLLSGLIARLFARYAAVNSFVRTRTRLIQSQEDVPWPMTPGSRGLI
ncbi:type VI secretion system baseplate subunit TssF [Amaricoccus sp.]|uniref:type VI secretion system baseplate subunit TssF n=1 Tax=Amaricoccus sp. TaxID=1872485 RepID=UPI001B607761|nr:type VI secretion system baseplate subunit TssF [Amaricoccus sp.]MBP7243402.1 type VI secretion system baseplate subunit TssF [Amaricoccus sp.]